jgi:hypothetical protein
MARGGLTPDYKFSMRSLMAGGIMAAEYYPKIGICYDDVDEREKIFLLLTYRCNAQCAHCLTESGPDKQERLELATAKAIIFEGAKVGKRFLVMSGGEPMLYPDEVAELTRHSASYGFIVCLGTNASWATSLNRAREVLARLQDLGLTALFPSSTTFHAKFVPPERVLYAKEACDDLGIVCEINFYPSHDIEGDKRLFRLLQLGDEVWYSDGLIRTGNDVSQIEHAYARRVPEDLDDCGSIHLAITPRGQAICNCNLTYHCTEFVGTPFYLGNVFESSVKEILCREQSDPVLQTLYNRGHRWLHQILDAAPDNVRELYSNRYKSKQYFSLTEYYLDVFHDELLAPYIRAEAARELRDGAKTPMRRRSSLREPHARR